MLNTDRYVDTMAPIAASPAVQKTVADKLDTAITGAIDFNALAREALPERADVLAPAIAAGAESAIRDGLDRFVASDRFQELWDEANRRAHSRVVALLTTGKSGRLTLEDNTVYLDFSAAVDRLKERLRERGFNRVADAIPASVDGRIPLLTSDGFSTARKRHQPDQGAEHRAPAAGAAVLRRPHPHVEAAAARVAARRARPRRHRPAAAGRGRRRALAYLGAIDQNVLPRQAASDIFDALISLLPHHAADHGHRGGRARRCSACWPASRRGPRRPRPARACARPRRAWPTTRAPPGSPSTAASSSGAWCCSAGLCSSPGTTRPRGWS